MATSTSLPTLPSAPSSGKASSSQSEQLKRLQNDEDQAAYSSDSNQTAPVLQKPKVPRFVDTRVPDIYAATKLGDRFSRCLANEKKDLPTFSQKCDEQANVDVSVRTVPDRVRSLAKFQWKKAEEPDVETREKLFTSEKNNLNLGPKPNTTSLSTFRDVTQISTGLQGNTLGPTIDMAKAFKGMSTSKVLNFAELTDPFGAKAPHSIPRAGATGQVKSPSLCIHGEKLPLDLSLKTNIRFTSASSFERCQRLTNKDLMVGMQGFLSATQSQGDCTPPVDTGCQVSTGNKLSVSFAEALHSWVYPQSVLPSSVLSTLASLAAHGGVSEQDFLLKRQLMWEDSFRSLYYMFRNGQCDLFYFSTQQFLAMFIRGEIRKMKKTACTAYITRSTRGLRALLQEQDIAFTMPLCFSEVTTSIEEIQELTEFEKSHPGQTRLVDSMIAVDNSPQSILAFNGSKSVHGLYDFLLNHRSVLSSTTGTDVPMLYSPVPFQNASIVMPEIASKQLRRPVETCGDFHEQGDGLAMNTTSLLEIKGTVLPPWVVWRICTAVRQLQHGHFEASFTTDPLSVGFNVAQDYEATEDQRTSTASCMMKELDALLLSSQMKVGFMKHFKLVDGSYVVTLSSA